MMEQRRGFGRERHTLFKAAVTLASVAAFGITWLALGASHDRPSNSAPSPTVTSDLQSVPGVTPNATSARRPRLSRGS